MKAKNREHETKQLRISKKYIKFLMKIKFKKLFKHKKQNTPKIKTPEKDFQRKLPFRIGASSPEVVWKTS